MPLHPSHRSLTLLLDDFAQRYLPPDALAFALIPPHAVPSTRLSQTRYPDVLIRHILSKIPPPPPQPVEDTPVTAPSDDKNVTETPASDDSKPPEGSKAPANPFVNMDVRNLKWMWTGLTFGKSSSARSTGPPTPALPTITAPDNASADGLNAANNPEIKVDDLGGKPEVTPDFKVEIDTDSLREAISTDNVHSPASRSSIILSPASPRLQIGRDSDSISIQELDADVDGDETAVATNELDHRPDDQGDSSILNDESQSVGVDGSQGVETQPQAPPPPVRPDPPPYLPLSIFMAGDMTPTATVRKKVLRATVCRTSNIT